MKSYFEAQSAGLPPTSIAISAVEQVVDAAGRIDVLMNAKLIDTPAGERPFRSVVGIDLGMRDLNDAVDPFRAGVLEGLGVPHMAGVGSAETD